MYSESRCQKVNLLRAAIVYYHYYKYGICAVGRRRAFLCIVDQEWSAHLYPPPVIRSRLRPAWEGRGSVCLVQAPVVFFFGGRRLLWFLSAFCGLRVSKMCGGRTAAFFRTPPCAPPRSSVPARTWRRPRPRRNGWYPRSISRLPVCERGLPV